VFALLMVTRRDAVHSALCLVVVLFQLAGVYVLLNAPFLAVLQVLVYAGAILVLFLFVIMLLQLREGPRLADNHNIQRMSAPIVGLLLAVELVAVISLASTLRAPALPAGTIQHPVTQGVVVATPVVNSAALANGVALNNPGGGWTPEEVDAAKGEPRALGIELYTNFLMPFEIASFILLVAVVGAIVLARREHATSEEYSTVGITMGRNAAPADSPQAIEQARVLMGVVPGIRVVRPLEGDPDAEVESPPEPVGAGNSTNSEGV
jgi:NADH-quinone oxidoreductase subunit J